jgi:hypothetical protein
MGQLHLRRCAEPQFTIVIPDVFDIVNSCGVDLEVRSRGGLTSLLFAAVLNNVVASLLGQSGCRRECL